MQMQKILKTKIGHDGYRRRKHCLFLAAPLSRIPPPLLERMTRLARRVQLKDLLSDRFLRELHHFLWTGPSVHGATTDAGWNCRDHAWVTALLARSLGHKPILLHGEALFVAGPNGRSESVSVRQRPHSWVAMEKVGAIDLSVKPQSRVSGNDFRLPIACVFANAWIPRARGKAVFTEDAAVLTRAAEELPQRRNQVSAVYLINEAEDFHAGHLTRAAGWIGSPLTLYLDSLYGNPSDLYAALMLHLRAFLEGGAQSLTGLPFDEAWRWIARVREGAIDRASRCIEARAGAGRQMSAQIAGQNA